MAVFLINVDIAIVFLGFLSDDFNAFAVKFLVVFGSAEAWIFRDNRGVDLVFAANHIVICFTDNR